MKNVKKNFFKVNRVRFLDESGTGALSAD